MFLNAENQSFAPTNQNNYIANWQARFYQFDIWPILDCLAIGKVILIILVKNLLLSNVSI